MAQPDFSIATHRVVRIDGGPLDYPARHIVIPDGVRAMPYGPRSRSKLSHFVAALRASIAIAAEFLGSDRGFTFFLGFFSGSMFTVAMAYVWSFFL